MRPAQLPAPARRADAAVAVLVATAQTLVRAARAEVRGH